MAMDTDTHPIESPLSHSPMHLHREPSTLYTESPLAPSPPTAHANETGNVPPETMDEAMDDDTKDPGPFQQRNDPATEPKDAVAESMDETMDCDSHPRPAEPPSRAPYPAEPGAAQTTASIGLPQTDHWNYMARL